MRLSRTLPTLALVIFLAGCATTKNQTIKNVFTFDHDGHSYQIVSINTETGEGTNFLNLVDENGMEALSARDLDQDGTLDVIIKGQLSLEEANFIYSAGISNAKLKGSYNEREPLRSFEATHSNTLYTIRSYYVEDLTLTNMFIIHNASGGHESILEDITGDGVLDHIEKGSITLEEAQLLYDIILKAGIEKGRIELIGTTYVVLEKSHGDESNVIVYNEED